MGLVTRLAAWWREIRGLEGPGSVGDLCRRLGVAEIRINKRWRGFGDPDKLNPSEVPLGYWWHKVAKRGGGTRLLYSPNPILKKVQRLLLRRVFQRLKVHPAAKGFRRGESIVTHARLHVERAVVVRADIRQFFPSTRGPRLDEYLRKIGWSGRAANLLLELCTRWKGEYRRLPQGAPTSPILSNLVNYRMDARLAGLAKKSGAVYSRYADDIIFSFAKDDRRFIRGVIRRIRRILWENGYRMHGRAKLRIMRRHQRQVVTGLVVNEKVQLPRKTRRWLRAVEHHVRTGRPTTLTPAQLEGWRAFARMVERQGK
jgi:RNA-directed DNA polymerase